MSDAAPGVEERRSAVRALQSLARLGEGEVTELFGLLGDSDWRVRRDATDVALAMAAADWVDRIVAAIKQRESVGLRNACIEIARAMGALYANRIAEGGFESPISPLLFDGVGGGDERTVDFLREHAGSSDANTSAAAIAAIARVGGEEAEALLLSLLDSEDRYRVIATLDGLQVLGTSLAYETVAPLLEDRIVWRGVVPLLANTGDVRAAAGLMRGLERPGELAREATLGLAALDAHLGTRAIPDNLGSKERERLRALTGADDVGQAATYLLIRAHDVGAMVPLLESLAEKRLTRDSVTALRAWGSAAAELVLQAPTPFRAVALELAAELAVGDAAATDVVRKALVAVIDDYDRHLVCAALRGLAISGGAEECEAIMRVALSGPEDVRAQAAAALSSISHREHQSVADVCRTLRLEPGTAYLAPVVALVLGSEARSRLVEGLSADDVALRAACATCLPHCGTDVTRHLAFAMSDESRDVRLAAAEALGQVAVGQDKAAELLVKSLSGFDDALARASAEALGELGQTSAQEALMSAALRRPGLAIAALRAAYRLGPENVDIDGLLQGDPAHLSLAAAELLEPVDPRWLRLLKHVSPVMRVRAAQSLSVWDSGARQPLEEALAGEQDAEVERAIRAALADTGGPV